MKKGIPTSGCKKLQTGTYLYRAYTIFRRDRHQFAAVPWKVMGIRGTGFRTLNEAKRWVDKRIRRNCAEKEDVGGPTKY